MTRGKEYRSVSITRLFMKVVGLWYVETPRERLLLHAVFAYAVWQIIFAILVEGVDLYYCIGDFYVSMTRRSFSRKSASAKSESQSSDLCISMLLGCNFITLYFIARPFRGSVPRTGRREVINILRCP